jgi:hypothetical protein
MINNNLFLFSHIYKTIYYTQIEYIHDTTKFNINIKKLKI